MNARATTLGTLFFLVSACSSSSDKLAGPSPSVADNDAAGVVASDSGTFAAPLPGTTRAVFQMDTFEIKPGEEFYKCQDYPNPFGKDIAILQSESVMTRGSHHIFAFKMSPNDVLGGSLNLSPDGSRGPLANCPAGGAEFHPYFHDAQIPKRRISYPPGIGRSLKATEGIRLMVHFLNTTDQTLQPGLTVTADYIDASAVQQLAAEFFLNPFALSVPPGHSVQSFTFPISADIEVLSSVSHMHRRGAGFEADLLEPAEGGVADGGSKKVLYTSTTWNEPPPDDYATPIAVHAGDVFAYGCTYENDTTTTFTFGQSALTNEMCIFQGTFSPSPDGTGIFGLPSPKH